MAVQQDDLASIISKIIQSNPLVGFAVAILIALWWIGKNDKDEEKKPNKLEEMTEEELIIALARVRAKKDTRNETGRVLLEIKKIVEKLEVEETDHGSGSSKNP